MTIENDSESVEVAQLRDEISRLRMYEKVVKSQGAIGKFGAIVFLWIWLGPKLSTATSDWIRAYLADRAIPIDETGRLVAAVLRRFTYVGTIALAIALAPVVILVWQNSILQDQIEAQTQTSVDELITQQIPWLIGEDVAKQELAMAYLTSSPRVARSGIERLTAVSQTLSGRSSCKVLAVVGHMRKAVEKAYPIDHLAPAEEVQYGFMDCPNFKDELWNPRAQYIGASFEDGFFKMQVEKVFFQGSLKRSFVAPVAETKGHLVIREAELDSAGIALTQRALTIAIVDSRLNETDFMMRDAAAGELPYLVINPWPEFVSCVSSMKDQCVAEQCKKDSVYFWYRDRRDLCEDYLSLTKARSLLANRSGTDLPIMFVHPSPYQNVSEVKGGEMK